MAVSPARPCAALSIAALSAAACSGVRRSAAASSSAVPELAQKYVIESLCKGWRSRVGGTVDLKPDDGCKEVREQPPSEWTALLTRVAGGGLRHAARSMLIPCHTYYAVRMKRRCRRRMQCCPVHLLPLCAGMSCCWPRQTRPCELPRTLQHRGRIRSHVQRDTQEEESSSTRLTATGAVVAHHRCHVFACSAHDSRHPKQTHHVWLLKVSTALCICHLCIMAHGKARQSPRGMPPKRADDARCPAALTAALTSSPNSCAINTRSFRGPTPGLHSP